MSAALLHRNAIEVAADVLAHIPVSVIQGARQVGKSTLAGMLAEDRASRLVTLDDPATLAAARVDPVGFVDQFPEGTLVIDELQQQPDLLRVIKASVDRDRRPGRFLITGSADLLRLRGEVDSLAGRAVTVRLRGLSQGERIGRRDDLIAHLASRLSDPAATRSTWRRADYVRAYGLGGFPEVSQLPRRLRARWLDSYLERVLERDAASLPSGGRSGRLRSVATLVAANQSGELVRARLAMQANIPATTITAYLDALDAVFLVDHVPPWTPNLTRREIGRTKGFVSDTALALRLARVTEQQLVPITADMIGGFTESFVAGELHKQQEWSETHFQLFHYRDRDGVEVDLVAELDDGRVIGMEIKSTATIKPEHFKGLRFLRDTLGERFVAGVVLAMVESGHRHDDRLWGMPIASVWESPRRPGPEHGPS